MVVSGGGGRAWGCGCGCAGGGNIDEWGIGWNCVDGDIHDPIDEKVVPSERAVCGRDELVAHAEEGVVAIEVGGAPLAVAGGV